MNLIVVGAGYAGLLSTLRLAGKNSEAQITLINATPYFTERIRLHQLASGQQPRQHHLSHMLRGRDVTFITGRVQTIDAQGQAVTVQTEDGSQVLHAESYPQLNIELITASELGAGLSAGGQTYLKQTFAQMGIALHEHTRVRSLEAGTIHAEDGRIFPYDLVVWAGAFTVPTLARNAGLKVNARGQIITDAYLRSCSHPEIYAVGDAAQVTLPNGQPLRMACATAMPIGAQAADNIHARLQGQPEAPFSYGYMLRCISLGRKRGLVQWVDAYDQPRPRITTGQPGAWIKELISSATIWMLQLERRFPGVYQWPKQRAQMEPKTEYGRV